MSYLKDCCWLASIDNNILTRRKILTEPSWLLSKGPCLKSQWINISRCSSFVKIAATRDYLQVAEYSSINVTFRVSLVKWLTPFRRNNQNQFMCERKIEETFKSIVGTTFSTTKGMLLAIGMIYLAGLERATTFHRNYYKWILNANYITRSVLIALHGFRLLILGASL